MRLNHLDHVNLRTHQLDAMVAWYKDILGLTVGTRPDFGIPGAWLYIGKHPVVHLVQVETECAAIAPKIEHFAFRATGYDILIERLKKKHIDYTVVPVPGLPLVQVNVADIDGNHIHIDFDAEEAGAAAAL